MTKDTPNGYAIFSECRTWRYLLIRYWGEGTRRLNVVGLNPSTADETINDPTIRRCIGFAKDWGYDALYMTNLFGYRSTDPKGLLSADDPIGRGNNFWLRAAAGLCDTVIAAWGAHPSARGRSRYVMDELLRDVEVHCLGTTKAGAPRHPLYLPKTTPYVRYGVTADDEPSAR